LLVWSQWPRRERSGPIHSAAAFDRAYGRWAEEDTLACTVLHPYDDVKRRVRAGLPNEVSDAALLTERLEIDETLAASDRGETVPRQGRDLIALRRELALKACDLTIARALLEETSRARFSGLLDGRELTGLRIPG